MNMGDTISPGIIYLASMPPGGDMDTAGGESLRDYGLRDVYSEPTHSSFAAASLFPRNPKFAIPAWPKFRTVKLSRI